MSRASKPLCFSQVEFASLRPAICLIARFGREFPPASIDFAPFSSHPRVPPLISPPRTISLLAEHYAFQVGADLPVVARNADAERLPKHNYLWDKLHVRPCSRPRSCSSLRRRNKSQHPTREGPRCEQLRRRGRTARWVAQHAWHPAIPSGG